MLSRESLEKALIRGSGLVELPELVYNVLEAVDALQQQVHEAQASGRMSRCVYNTV